MIIFSSWPGFVSGRPEVDRDRPEVDEPDQGQQDPKVLMPFRSFHIVEIVFYLIAIHQLFSIFFGPNSVLQIQVDRLGDHSKCFSHNV